LDFGNLNVVANPGVTLKQLTKNLESFTDDSCQMQIGSDFKSNVTPWGHDEGWSHIYAKPSLNRMKRLGVMTPKMRGGHVFLQNLV
jgi:hypothetical protein